MINLPPPPSNPDTPSEMGPGTPGSTTTSLSALSTTAIKDGHQGHAPPHDSSHAHKLFVSSSNPNTLDAERADRISRLPGLERVATVRGNPGPSQLNPGSASNPPPGYFENANPAIKERSTVGSASATGSVGAHTAWTSSSDMNDADKMSEDQDDGMSSNGGFSDEGNASLVGFGEGANSVVSGPASVTARNLGRDSGVSSPSTGKPNAVPPYIQYQSGGMASSSSSTATTPSGTEQQDAKMLDGMTYDSNVVDTANRPPAPAHGRHDSATGSSF
ncbi:MAG: hypothetical protein M1817_004318 [Caeruleum heppii]|nr:MAG: hypothetical protein M1817_004318 [Caeruleum heppii]